MINVEINKKGLTYIFIAVLSFVALFMVFATVGNNNNGYRTVVQYPTGYTYVKSTPGYYFDWFGTSTTYPDVLTYAFDLETTSDSDSIFSSSNFETEPGVTVRYQDGGTGTIFGVARFSLPTNENDMLTLHRAFRTEAGVREKLLKPVVRESLNLTAGLMTSEEAYAEKRNEFLEWSEDQVSNGKYLTNLEQRTQIVEPEERDGSGAILKRAVTRIQDIPVIRRIDGVPMRGLSPFVEYGITVSGFQLTDWGFEPRTLEQIQQKRAAEMAIITSQADAAKANQQRIQAIAEGQRNVAEAQYRQEVIKAEAVVVAEREAEVAKINAARQVEVNRQNYLAQEQDVLAAEQEALAIDLRTTAQAEARERMLEADGALEQKLNAYVRVMETFAKEFAKQKWTPEIVMAAGGNSGVAANPAMDMINLVTTQTARNLALDLSVNSGPQRTVDGPRR